MKKILLLLVTGFLGFSGQAAIFTVQNNNSAYTPNLITITAGDTVSFVLGSTHDAREVSQATWNANSNVALSGGFQTPLGGGAVLPVKLGVGTHYYVCTPHVQFGMKGRIIVQSAPSGLDENDLRPSFSLYPNPSSGKFRIHTDGLQQLRNYNVEIYNVLGKLIYSAAAENPDFDIDIHHVPAGIYLVKITDQKTTLTRRIRIG